MEINELTTYTSYPMIKIIVKFEIIPVKYLIYNTKYVDSVNTTVLLFSHFFFRKKTCR